MMANYYYAGPRWAVGRWTTEPQAVKWAAGLLFSKTRRFELWDIRTQATLGARGFSGAVFQLRLTLPLVAARPPADFLSPDASEKKPLVPRVNPRNPGTQASTNPLKPGAIPWSVTVHYFMEL